MVEALAVAALVAGYQNGIQLLPLNRRFPRLTPAIGVSAGALAAVVLVFMLWDPVQAGLGLEAWRWAPAWGVLFVGIAGGIALLARRHPGMRGMVADPRLVSMDRTEYAVHVGLRIPLVSALAEEVLFRGVVYGLVAMVAPWWAAIAVSSVAFGLWHVVAGLDHANAHGMDLRRRTGHVAGTVLFTALAGVGFGLLRFWTGGIWASVVVHAVVNMTFAVAGRRLGSVRESVSENA